MERIAADAGHGIGDDDALEAAAIIESIRLYDSHRIGDDDAREAAATLESTCSDGGHRTGDGHIREVTATQESTRHYGGHRAGDGNAGGCRVAAYHYCLVGALINERVSFLRIVCCNNNIRSPWVAIGSTTVIDGVCPIESTASDGGHRIGDNEMGKSFATMESMVSDAGHRIGEGDTGETGAAVESILSDGGHRIGGSVVCYG